MNLEKFRQKRKLIACNKQNSVSVVIPSFLLQLLEWKAGQHVNVGLTQDGNGITIYLDE